MACQRVSESDSCCFVLIDQSTITPEMYRAVVGKGDSSVASWHNAFVSALGKAGVSLTEHQVGEDDASVDAFLAMDDRGAGLASTLPDNTFGYGYVPGDGPAPKDVAKLSAVYAKSTKTYLYHFTWDGIGFGVVLSVRPNRTVNLTVTRLDDGKTATFPLSSAGDNADSSFVAKLVGVMLSMFKSKADELYKVESPSFSMNQVKAMVSGGSVKSSLTHSPVLTKYDIQSLLSDAQPYRVWYSPEHRLAVYQCRFGLRLATIGHSSSGWHVSTLRQCWLVKSAGKLLVSRKASFYEDSVSSTVSCRTAVMFRFDGQSHFLPLE